MGAFIDITGKKFGRLTAIEKAGTAGDKQTLWMCTCDCGNTVTVRGKHLRSGHTQSCGCLNIEKTRDPSCKKSTHGMKKTHLYSRWRNMKERCYNKNRTGYARYGGRGIEVCPEWRNSFETFRDWAMSNGYDENAPRGQYTLERKDNDGPYCPENCRWATYKEQANNRSSNDLITYNDETKTVKEWSERCGIPYPAFRARLIRGWDIARAMSTPIKRTEAKK